MREGWKEVTLAEISTKIGDGLHGTPKYDDAGDYYFINGNNLGNGKIYIYPTTNRISQIEYQKIKKELTDRTILLGINGTIGNLGFYNNEKVALGKSACYINLKNNVNKNYIRYVLEFNHFQNYAQLFATGSTIRNLGLKAIRNYKFSLPPIETQRKIASILSGYDDLIENNLERIKILEEMAQQTYEEWFVRMRFPGYETAVMNEETGLPEGWEKKTLIGLGKISTGKTPSTLNDDFYNGNIPFIKTPDMSGSTYVIETNQYLTELGSDNQKGKLIEKNSLVVSCIGSAGAFALVSKPSQFNQQINAITFKREEYIFFTYCYSKSLKEKLEALGSNGATMTNVNKTKFEKIEIVLPDSQLLNKFHKIFKLNFENILNLQSQNQRLREARDLLLPRLMMGMIEVDSLNVNEELGLVAEESEKYNKL